jgi:hypothetical protein
MITKVEPEVTVVRSCGMVSDVDVVRICDPVRSRHLISVQHTEGRESTDSEIPENLVLGLNTVFHEVRVTSNVVRDILDDSEIMDTMHGDSSVVGVMNGVTLHVGLGDSSNHMEMDWISSHTRCLTATVELCILDSSDDRFITWTMHHHVATVLKSL